MELDDAAISNPVNPSQLHNRINQAITYLWDRGTEEQGQGSHSLSSYHMKGNIRSNGKKFYPYIHKSFWSFLLCAILSFYGNHHLPTLCAQSLSHVWLFAAPWTVALQAPLSRGFSKGEYWSGLPFPPPGDLPDSGIEPASLVSPTRVGRYFTISATREAPQTMWFTYWCYYLFFVSSS